MTEKKPLKDIMWEKLEKKAKEKGFRLDGGVGDNEGWSCALVKDGDKPNTRYAIIDYAEYYEEGYYISWTNFAEGEEDVEIGYRKTAGGVMTAVMKKY